MLSPKWNIYSAPHPLKTQGLLQKAGENEEEEEVVGDYKETVSSGHSRAVAHMNS